MTAASLLNLSTTSSWRPLEEITIFDFIVHLENNVSSNVLNKELSYFGGIRLTKEEIDAAIKYGRLGS
jgi:hypothetical protein